MKNYTVYKHSIITWAPSINKYMRLKSNFSPYKYFVLVLRRKPAAGVVCCWHTDDVRLSVHWSWSRRPWLHQEPILCSQREYSSDGSISLWPGFVSSRNAPERRSGPFWHIAAKFRFHLNESDKFALFGSKMPSASAPRPPYRLTLPRSPYS